MIGPERKDTRIATNDILPCLRTEMGDELPADRALTATDFGRTLPLLE